MEVMGRYALIGTTSTTYDRRFHELWTSSVGRPGYVKATWSNFDGRLERARTKEELDLVLSLALTESLR